ncbi:unnamed protein product [Protopolystoma xenopodis]|uniref:Uncharacterized protein n=1 Tax=Protopolystoma xenopodis TaxID=117903 RepID=A0A3S5BQE2_9PLAT|nr:unnamed protein product [Protopolystoma xenopodis]
MTKLRKQGQATTIHRKETVALRRSPDHPHLLALATHRAVLLFDIRCPSMGGRASSAAAISTESTWSDGCASQSESAGPLRRRPPTATSGVSIFQPPLDTDSGVRSLNFFGRVLSFGTSAGHVHFYDLATGRELPIKLTLETGPSVTDNSTSSEPRSYNLQPPPSDLYRDTGSESLDSFGLRHGATTHYPSLDYLRRIQQQQQYWRVQASASVPQASPFFQRLRDRLTRQLSFRDNHELRESGPSQSSQSERRHQYQRNLLARHLISSSLLALPPITLPRQTAGPESESSLEQPPPTLSPSPFALAAVNALAPPSSLAFSSALRAPQHNCLQMNSALSPPSSSASDIDDLSIHTAISSYIFLPRIHSRTHTVDVEVLASHQPRTTSSHFNYSQPQGLPTVSHQSCHPQEGSEFRGLLTTSPQVFGTRQSLVAPFLVGSGDGNGSYTNEPGLIPASNQDSGPRLAIPRTPRPSLLAGISDLDISPPGWTDCRRPVAEDAGSDALETISSRVLLAASQRCRLI